MPTVIISLAKKGLIAFLLAAFAALIIHVDIRLLGSHAGEDSLIEYVQEVILSLIVIQLFVIARTTPSHRSLLILIGAFFSCLLIRELDGVFDQIVHGFWKYPAWAIALGACYYSFVLHRSATLYSLTAYMRHPSFGMMLCAMALLMVFSRLFGMGELWGHLLDEGYARAAKNTAEEGLELVSYAFIGLANLWYALSLKSER